MSNDTIVIRPAQVNDAKKLLDIYSPYILNTAVTFEYDVPSTEQFKERILSITQKYPYILAQCGDEILGYAYASEFKSRAAYSCSAEVSIYVKQERRHMGTGKKLYTALENILRAQNICNLYACIASPKTPDKYLDKNSINFHKAVGYSTVGEFHNCAYKFGIWYNMVFMEKFINNHSENRADLIPITETDINSLLA